MEEEESIRTVAVIGGGISGVSAAAHLLKQGLGVVLFERSNVAGGVWHFDSRAAPDPAFPNEKPSVGDYQSKPEHAYSTPPPEADDLDALEVSHAPPGPCYAGLMNNVSTPLMQTTLAAWPLGTLDFVSQKILEQYIQDISDTNGVKAVTKYNTRVEDVQKQDKTWRVRTTSLEKTSGGSRISEKVWRFDAVVVASGHYNVPRIPDMPGLSKLKASLPDRVQHSKSYRNPKVFEGKTILLIGAGVSSCDIAKESSQYAKHIYQSSRGGVLDLPESFLPAKATRIGAIERFGDIPNARTEADVGDSTAISVKLRDGTELRGIDHVIMCTGYMTSYPFLRHLHSDTLSVDQANDEILVTAEGSMVHNLHKDIFYIPDPTLAFIGAPYHIATFSLFEFQAQVMARVFAGKARLPSSQAMRDEYNLRVTKKGLGRDFHSLRGKGEEQAYVADLVAWMNKDALALGASEMLGHTKTWHEANLAREEKLRWLRASRSNPAAAAE